ncbi:MmgE/PrpD family protein [Desulfofundulus sp. TPOSR]|uniref:MmgE/PrpD family protein n=1 Tax=Desulfofundulus sp. TPOSR TaxID=2714340 RepID=UPI001408FB47|nr:MmgE/PrpD family protein [Desulfofundulus sp. TPOSR]NHM28750.1 MmgE/PrpD family protein [Desulfofundulus sp. TPOSR]
MSQGVTLELANFLVNLTYEDLNGEVVAKAKMHVLDGIGNQIHGSQEPGSQILLKMVGELQMVGRSTVITSPVKTWAPLAGLANGNMAHAIEMDDAHRDALVKAGSVLVPAALAVAEHCQASGKDFLLALICGYEAMVRIGLAVNPGHRNRGYHSTGTIGAFGAAAVTAKLLKLDHWKTANAFGIAGTQSAGLTAFLDHPSMIKGFNAGKAAFNGILAGLLAQGGFTGPVNILEGREGFCRAYSDEVKLEQITMGFGGPLKIMEVGFKPHAACRYAHGPIDAVAEMITGPISPATVKSVTIWTSPLAIRQSNINEPETLHAAQGSTPYSVALAMVTGKKHLNVEDFKVNWDNQEILNLARRIKMLPDEESYGYMGRGCRVKLEMDDGSIFENSLELPKGEPENPLTLEELEDKFATLVNPLVGEETGNKIKQLVKEIEQMPNIEPLTELLRVVPQKSHH